MKSEENIGHIVRGKHSITSLSLMYEISTTCSCIICQVKQENTKEQISFFLLLINLQLIHN